MLTQFKHLYDNVYYASENTNKYLSAIKDLEPKEKLTVKVGSSLLSTLQTHITKETCQEDTIVLCVGKYLGTDKEIERALRVPYGQGLKPTDQNHPLDREVSIYVVRQTDLY